MCVCVSVCNHNHTNKNVSSLRNSDNNNHDIYADNDDSTKLYLQKDCLHRLALSEKGV